MEEGDLSASGGICVVGTMWRNVLMWLELVTGTVEAVVAAVTTTTGGACLA